MTSLNKDALDRFLCDSALIALLATLEDNGTIYQVPVWYEWDGACVWIVSKPKAHYIANLRGDPRSTVSVATQHPPYVRAMIQGEAELIEADEEWLAMGFRMAERYLGREAGRAYIEKTRTWKRIFIRIRPTRIRSWDGGATGHEWGRYSIESPGSPPGNN